MILILTILICIDSIRVEKISLNPFNRVWRKAPKTKIELYPQNITQPFLEEKSIEYIEVASINDGDKIAFLIIWSDKTRDAIIDVDKFTDAVAIQLPFDAQNLPAFMMGNKGGRVHIIHWKALWQDDLDKGFRDVHIIHPNYWVDMYFFSDKPIYAEGEFPAVSHFKTPEALNYMPGVYSRNPISILERKVPVEEAVAEGFGTLTTQKHQNAEGFGLWKNGKWYVIIARPIVSYDSQDAPILDKTFIAFAVWDGSSKNVGARKHYTIWTELNVKK
ncbi:MAG: ethylbenzene dehydrogenase-related protein [bacterium]|nr:ethylbenzene dehydrogenase-related protein [bacterium]